tara:strand:- start:2328 stop:3236 length:909 start_codon:yes stop_codon:yes gene_type:complete
MSNINNIEAAKIIENNINLSFTFKYTDSQMHPIHFIQAIKALIGLNLDNPNRKLLDFSKLYFDKQAIDKYIFKSQAIQKVNPVVSLQDLENALKSNNRQSAIDIFNHIKLVSSEIHILEYLIEISLKQSGKSFLIIWSLYKSVLFLKDKNIDKFKELAIDILLNDKFRDINQNNSITNINAFLKLDLSIDSLNLYAHLNEAYKTDLIRSENIQKLIESLLVHKFKDLKNNDYLEKKYEPKYPKLITKGRPYILDLINQMECKLNVDIILFLDSIRTLFRFNDKKNHKLIIYHLENKMESLYV